MRIGLLGAVEAWHGPGGDPVPLRGVRLRGLLARLALDAGRPVGPAALVDDLWGAAPPDAAGNALQALVSRLRRAVGAELVETVPGGYRLAVAADAVDALRFVELVRAATGADPGRAHATIAEALRLWRGPALADVAELPFAAAVAARLDERRAVAVEQSARLALRLGRADAELDGLAGQLAAAPLRESTAALLARGLHAPGRQAAALAVLDRTAAHLAEELGVDPGPELADARMAVLRGEVPARAPEPTPVGGLNSFVGRDRDVERVRALLGTERLVTLIGPGGAGKTRLARESVVPTERPVVAELASLTGAAQLPATVLAAVGEPELILRTQDDALPDIGTRLQAAIGADDLLLVLDNCEHLVDGVAALTETLLRSCPRLRVLATSREPLGVPGEVLHPVEALVSADAVALFRDRAAAVRPGFVLDADVTPVVADICARLDGQPLPIELAAARLRTLSPAEILARLDDRFRLLTSGARTALPRHQTLRAVVDWSWELLGEPERAVARRLGVFAGGATAAAAQQVCGAPEDDVFELLASLVDKSLVVAVPQPEGAATRYRMLETIREYAIERLDEAGERAIAVAAHTRIVVELAEEAEPHLRRREQLDWLARLRAEADEIDIALRRSVADGDAVSAHRLVAAMAWSWLIRGRNEEALRWVDIVHRMEGPVPVVTRTLVTGLLALLSVARGDLAAAVRHVEAAIAMAAPLPRPRHPFVELIQPVYEAFRDPTDGASIRLLSETTDDPWVRGFTLEVQAQLAENVGRIDEQRRLIRTAHELFTTIGDRFGLGMVVFSLGELEEVAGQFDAAAAAYDESIALATELGNEDDLPQFLSRRALLEARRGDLDAARAVLARVPGKRVTAFDAAGSVSVAAAEIERLAGNIDEARVHLATAQGEMAENGFGGGAVPQRRAFFAMTWAQVEMAAGDLPAARDQMAAAIAAAVESGDGPVAATVAQVAAQLALAEGDAGCAAVLLGVAVAQRGILDRGSPDVMATVEGMRSTLGEEKADELMREGSELPRPAGLARLSAFAERPGPASGP